MLMRAPRLRFYAGVGFVTAATPTSSNSRRRAARIVASPGRGWPQQVFAHRPPE